MATWSETAYKLADKPADKAARANKPNLGSYDMQGEPALLNGRPHRATYPGSNGMQGLVKLLYQPEEQKASTTVVRTLGVAKRRSVGRWRFP